MSSLKKIVDFIYNSQSSMGITRAGCYCLQRTIFEKALSEYLKTGVDHLPGFDALMRASWFEKTQRSGKRDLNKVSDANYIKSFLAGNEFWKPSLFTKDDLASMNNYLTYRIAK